MSARSRAALTLLAIGAALAPAVAAPDEAAAPNPVAFEGQISGTVFGPDREAVSGSSVAILGESGATFYGSSTDPRGRYAVKGLARDEYSVLVMDPSGALLRKDKVSVRPLFRNLVDFITGPAGARQTVMPSLPPGNSVSLPPFTLRVIMASRDDHPVSEAWFTAVPLEEGATSRRGRTDSQGRLTLEDLPGGYYRLTARALGHVTWSLGPLLLKGEGERELHLSLLPFPLGHQERIEDLIVPIKPAPPEAFEAEIAPDAAADPDAADPE